LKASFQRELESYKVVLIASAERHKARAELEKAIAIKHTLMEYDALFVLHGSLVESLSIAVSRSKSVSGKVPPSDRTMVVYREVQTKDPSSHRVK
jgi:hypothetical protein